LVKDSDPAFDCLKKRKNISAAREESHRAISRKSWRKRSTQPASIRKELIRRQQENDRADLKFFESLSHGFAESARLTNERTKEMIAGFPGKYLPPGVPAPPAGAPVFQILSNASRIDLEPFGPSSPLNSYQSSITSEGNLIQFDQTTCVERLLDLRPKASLLWRNARSDRNLCRFIRDRRDCCPYKPILRAVSGQLLQRLNSGMFEYPAHANLRPADIFAEPTRASHRRHSACPPGPHRLRHRM
jgi:hypothetical protein